MLRGAATAWAFSSRRRSGASSARASASSQVQPLRAGGLVGVVRQRLGVLRHHQVAHVQVRVLGLVLARGNAVDVHVQRARRGGVQRAPGSPSPRAPRAARWPPCRPPSATSAWPPGCSQRFSFPWCTSTTRAPAGSTTTALPVKCAVGLRAGEGLRQLGGEAGACAPGPRAPCRPWGRGARAASAAGGASEHARLVAPGQARQRLTRMRACGGQPWVPSRVCSAHTGRRRLRAGAAAMARILVIDDHDTMREGMAVTLKKLRPRRLRGAQRRGWPRRLQEVARSTWSSPT